MRWRSRSSAMSFRPRQRGRYQGYFGAVFAVSSVAGPLLGGFFVEHLSWHWIFFINIPLGIVALVVTDRALHGLRHVRREHSIDYLGAVLLVTGVSTLLLGMVNGGEAGWTSPEIIGLLGGGLVLSGIFIWWESHAAEPILPLRLFHNRIFSVSSGIGFSIGFAMFGAIVFLPLYLQIVRGVSPTQSGLEFAAADGRPVHSLRHLRTADHHDRPLQALPHRWNRHHRRGVGSSFDPGLGYSVLADGPVHAGPGRGDRPGYAGHRPCHAELRRPTGHGGGHLLGYVLPVPGRTFGTALFGTILTKPACLRAGAKAARDRATWS